MTTNTTTIQGALCSGARFSALLSLLALTTSGCTQEPLCEELSDCGGPVPTGDWVLDPGHPSCSEDLYVPPNDTRLLGGEITPARQPTIEPALFDWCNLLVAGGGTQILLQPPRFYYESGPIGAAIVAYHPDGTFSAGLTRTGEFILDFPAICMRGFGATDGIPAANPANPTGGPDPAGPPVDVCEQLQVPLANSGTGEGSYQNTDCYPNPEDPQGCLCSFEVTETGGPSGKYRVLDNGTIQHVSFTGFPSKANYCNTGTRLQLTGKDGEYLFNVKGLRTLDLAPAPP